MDYCHECRRHLNGALACAGCGRPAEELRHDDLAPPAPDHVFELARDEEGPRPAARRAQAPDSARSPGRAQSRRAARAADGRRARRRQGRALLLATTGLVLVAGAVSLASLALEDRPDGPATSVREDDLALPAPLPEPSRSTHGAADPDEIEVTPSAYAPSGGSFAPDSAGDGEGGSSGTPRSSDPASGGEATGSGPGAGPGPGQGSPGSGGGSGKEELKNPGGQKPPASPSASATAVPPPPGDEPETRPTASGDPTPTPTPTATPEPPEKCTPWLWWCF